MDTKGKTRGFKRFLTFVLAFAMLAAYIPVAVSAAESPAEPAEGAYVLEASALTAFAAGDKKDGDSEPAGTNNYFTVIYSAKSKVDGSNKKWDDGYESGQRINFGGKATTEKNAVKFTTSNPATVKIWWAQGGDDNREMAILNTSGEVVVKTSGTYEKNAAYLSTLELSEGGTYFLGGEANNNYIFKVEVTEEVAASKEYTFESSALTPFVAGDKKDGDTEKAGTDEYFTLIYSAKTKVDKSEKTWDDDYKSAQRVNFGGKASTEKNAVKFETTGAATVKVWWVEGGNDNRQMAILDSEGNVVVNTSGEHKQNDPYLSTLELTEAGTYFLGGETNNNYIFKVTVTTVSGEKPPRAEWETVAAPTIDDVAVNKEDPHKVDVTVTANVGYDGADRVTVSMTNEAGETLEERNSLAEKDTHVLTFTPGASGKYTFSALVARTVEGEDVVKEAAETKTFDFTLPLDAPVMKSATNNGGGSVTVTWNPVKEADSYEVEVAGQKKTVTECEATFEGLTIGEKVTFTVTPIRGEEKGASATLDCQVKDKKEVAWTFAAFGTSTNTKDNGYEGNANDGKVRVFSTGGKGKIVANSYDGIAFYYTEIDPKTQNFVLSATATVNTWKYSNGQEAFGLMAADRVGVHGSTETLWNNCYMSLITRLEYNWDNGELVDTGGARIKMYQGVGAMAKTGVTPENYLESMPTGFKSVTTTLETSQAEKGAGQYNLVGNATNAVNGTIENPITEFKLKLVKNNTGYWMYYTDGEGVEHVVKTYEPDALSVMDDTVYVGFFAARNFDVTFTDINFEIRDPKDDPEPEERPLTKVTPSYSFVDDGVSNTDTTEIVYRGSVAGTMLLKDAEGNTLYEGRVAPYVKLPIKVKLAEGENKFNATVTPDPDFKPSEYEILRSYDPWVNEHVVTYKKDARTVIYVSPTGTEDAEGTKTAPTTLASAVKWAAPGTKIYLMAGTYELESGLTLTRGINGTAEKPIYLMADPEAGSRPVLDFMNKGGGLTIVAHYWHLAGFDVTRSTGTGVHVSGNHNVVERVITFRNGNTGLQISRQKGSDDCIADWPSHNLILNCSSYLNADLPGYEDADGFAAKLTVGIGNVFDGCVSAYNADDGWDLYAKVETGSIGTVTIKNSVAFKNGYDLDENGKEINAGNGNGFKLGGENHPDGHTLINSVAFANKANGITSNSCPNNVIKDCTSFGNGGANIALYTNKSNLTTGYVVDGLISYTKSGTPADSFKLQGQDDSVIHTETNYLNDGSASKNSLGVAVADDWFVNLDMDKATSVTDCSITRNEDGTVNLHGFLELTDKAPKDAGARLTDPSHAYYYDVPAGDYYADAVYTVTDMGLMNGIADDQFDPYGLANRAMLVTVAWRLAGSPKTEVKNPFVDVKAGDYYYDAVNWAYENEVILGIDATHFDPYAKVNREVMVTVLHRYYTEVAGLEGTAKEGALTAFTDAGELSDWAQTPMAWAVENGIVLGITPTTIDPHGLANRAQLATVFARCIEKFAE